MEFKQIKELMASMRRFGLSRLVLKQGGFEIELEVPYASSGMEPSMMAPPAPHQMSAAETPGAVAAPLPSAAPLARATTDEGRYIRSPFVGTFYTAPSPDAAAFAKVGDQVREETVVCIVEAMKVMNEIRAGTSGTISEILVENGQPVEFGTKLFRIT
jgi:acetyl-CoA carboxylase biotin carboxyl carrier protein